MEEVKSTVSIAEKVVNSMVNDPPSVSYESGCEKPFKFSKPFAHGKRNRVKMNYNLSITDDSGFIPFEKEIERFVNSGESYQKYMRMAFPNGSTGKVVDDYEQDFGSMSRLDAINFVNERSSILQNRLIKNKTEMIKQNISDKMSNSGSNNLESVPNAVVSNASVSTDA